MLFTVGECVAWCADRGLDFFNKSQQLTPVQQQKYRQELHKANELEHKERVRKGEYGSVAEFERLTAAMLQQLRLHMIEIATELKEIGGVKGKQGETMDAKLIEGFNRIAGMPVE